MTQSNGSMNFLPEDYVEKRQAARTAVICIGLLVIVVTGIVGAWMFVKWQAQPIFDHAAQVEAEFEDMSKKISEAQEMNAEKAKMLAKAELTTTLMERVRRSALLEELTRLQPKGVNMVSLELKSRELPQPELSDVEKAKRQQDGLPPEPEKPPEFDFTLDLIGTAPTDAQVAAYISALGKSKLLADVNLLFSEEFKRGEGDAKEIVRKFHVEMRINPEADLRRVDESPLTSAQPVD
jgi:Tfp pilus assembly protein PilN